MPCDGSGSSDKPTDISCSKLRKDGMIGAAGADASPPSSYRKNGSSHFLHSLWLLYYELLVSFSYCFPLYVFNVVCNTHNLLHFFTLRTISILSLCFYCYRDIFCDCVASHPFVSRLTGRESDQIYRQAQRCSVCDEALYCMNKTDLTATVEISILTILFFLCRCLGGCVHTPSKYLDVHNIPFKKLSSLEVTNRKRLSSLRSKMTWLADDQTGKKETMKGEPTRIRSLNVCSHLPHTASTRTKRTVG